MKTGIIRYKSSLMLFSLMSEIIIALSDVLKNRTILDDRSGKTFVKCTDYYFSTLLGICSFDAT
jgi:hypothetical protein